MATPYLLPQRWTTWSYTVSGRLMGLGLFTQNCSQDGQMQTPILNTTPCSTEHKISKNGLYRNISKELPLPIQEPQGASCGPERLFLERTQVSPCLYLGNFCQLYSHIQEELPLTPKEHITTIPLVEPSTCFPTSCTALFCSCTRIIVNFRILPHFQRTKAKIKNTDFPYVNENDKALASLYYSFLFFKQ